MSANTDELFRLVELLCTTDQIKRLLRLGKEREEDVRITAEKKTDLVQRNLKEALSAGAVNLEQIYSMVRTAEENGNQHIFYFKPRSKSYADTLTLENVARQLWGADWQKKNAFPNVRVSRNKYICGDFRLWDPATKPRDWIMKIYGLMVIERFTGREKEEDDRLYKEFIREELRIVLMARWNNPDLLELRVQQDQSRRRIQAWVDQLWSMLGPAVTKDQFVPWTLAKARRRLIEEEEEHHKIYQFRDTRVIDPVSNRASFETYAPQGNLFASIESKEAIRTILRAPQSQCTHLTVTWLKSDGGILTEDRRTLLGDREPNEVIFPAWSEAKEVDYVTDQLRYFSR